MVEVRIPLCCEMDYGIGYEFFNRVALSRTNWIDGNVARVVFEVDAFFLRKIGLYW